MSGVAPDLELALARPDDWHVHFRDGAALDVTVPPLARVFGRVVAMPNLKPPVTTVAAALAYADALRAAAARGAGVANGFEPLVSLYLTDATAPEELARARASGLVAAKWYPVGATTNSEAGVSDARRMDDQLAAMAEAGLVLQVHGEVTDPDVDVFDREAAFVARVLAPLVARHPRLRVVLEHVTSAAGVAFVRAARDGVAATVTAHHLLIDRNDLFRGGLRPHCYCLPVAKTRADRDALVAAATSGDPRFFLGSDSAPHARRLKESAAAPAGIYTGHTALELYAEAFEDAGRLDRLEAFASHFGADFYGLPRATERVVLRRGAFPVPDAIAYGDDALVPFRAGQSLRWRVAGAAELVAADHPMG